MTVFEVETRLVANSCKLISSKRNPHKARCGNQQSFLAPSFPGERDLHFFSFLRTFICHLNSGSTGAVKLSSGQHFYSCTWRGTRHLKHTTTDIIYYWLFTWQVVFSIVIFVASGMTCSRCYCGDWTSWVCAEVYFHYHSIPVYTRTAAITFLPQIVRISAQRTAVLG